MFEAGNAGIEGVFAMDGLSPQTSLKVLMHFLDSGWFDISMTPADTSSWYPTEADLPALVRHLERLEKYGSRCLEL